MANSKSTSPTSVYQIKVTLEGSKPSIWRRLLVRSDITLGGFHPIIQAAFGWQDYHLHQFLVGGTYYGEPHPDCFDYVEMLDEQEVTLGQIVTGKGFKLRYEYDFGDSWLHQVQVEELLPVEQGQDYPVCVKGRRACPPEDVGGMGGYYHFLEAIRDSEHEEHREYLAWVGGEFDPEAFDLGEVNRALAALGQGLPRLGILPPLYRFILNPYSDARFSRCPMCEQKMRQRMVPLFIHVDPFNPTVLGYTCRYCPDCDLLIAHQDQIEALLANHYAELDPAVVGNDYLVIGTVERKTWREGMKQGKGIDYMQAHLRDFKEVLTIEYQPAGWHPASELDEQ